MKAFTIDGFGQEGAVRELPEPAAEPGTVLVNVRVAGVNPIDWKVRDGKSGERAFPLVLGQDFAGIVERVGQGVTRVKPGDRIFGCAREHGAYAEETLIPEREQASPFSLIPDGLSDDAAAALPTPALTALASVAALGAENGTSLLIVGAAGAVGSAALQIASGRGAEVVAVVKPGQEDDVRKLGACEAIAAGADVLDAVRSRHAEPFDAVLDLVSDGETLKKNAPLLRRGGKLVTTIHVADEQWFRELGIAAINIVMNETPQSSPQGLDQVARMALEGSLVLNLAGERPLSEAGRALDELKAGKASGKLLLRIA